MWKKFILLAAVTAMSLTGAALAAALPAPPSPSKVLGHAETHERRRLSCRHV